LTRLGLSLYLCALFAVALIAQPRAEAPVVSPALDSAISWLVRFTFRHPARHDEYRHELATALEEAGEETSLDPLLILSIAYCESGLWPGAQGRLGEIGLLQVHGEAARGEDLTTVHGQVRAGARWLRASIDKCGGEVGGGIARYATGYTCDWSKKSKPRLFVLVSYRLNLWAKLRGEGEEKKNDHIGNDIDLHLNTQWRARYRVYDLSGAGLRHDHGDRRTGR